MAMNGRTGRAPPTGTDSPPGRGVRDSGGWRRTAAGVIASLALVGVALVLASGPAGAHGPDGSGETPVTFAIVVALPVVAGLAGGAATGLLPRLLHPGRAHQPMGRVLGPLLVVLGGAFLLEAVGRRPNIALFAASTVVIAAALAGGRASAGSRCWKANHAHLSVAAVGLHRTLEGLVVGVLYGTGAAVGLVGAVFAAGHALVETAAVGGALSTRRANAAAALVLLQAGYAGGAVAGVLAIGSIPTPVRIGALALVGGLLLVGGLVETRRSFNRRPIEPGQRDRRGSMGAPPSER